MCEMKVSTTLQRLLPAPPPPPFTNEIAPRKIHRLSSRKTRHSLPNVVLILGRHRRRSPNIKVTSCERLVFAGIFLIARLRHSGLTLPSVTPEDVGSLPPQVDRLQRNKAVSTPSTRGYYVEPQWAIGYELGLMPSGYVLRRVSYNMIVISSVRPN